MRNKRPGCITPSGLSAALITALVIAVSIAVQGGAMFSPGALNAVSGPALGGVVSHEAIGGKCAACHPAIWDGENMTNRCMRCHNQIEADIADPQSLHGALISIEGETSCLRCHTEHHGSLAQLTRLDIQDFPHDVTGFALTAHGQKSSGASFECKDCHSDDFRRMDPSICEDCHATNEHDYIAEHTSTFGSDCLACHDGEDRFDASFDHAGTAFPLSGEHENLECAACHLGQHSAAALASTQQECFACHQEDDAHKGALGEECSLCHMPTAWTPSTFDHDRSAFPLTGAHTSVQCSGCHQNAVFKGTAAACAACHQEPPVHAGLFKDDCATCHRTAAWLPASFNGPHRFPMDHEDANTCRDCHAETFNTYTCYTCHDQGEMIEEHNDEGVADLNDCATCHPNGTKDDAEDRGNDD